MRSFGRALGVGVIICASLGVGMALPAAGAVTGGPVTTTPAPWTPHFASSSIPVSKVRQLAACGATMYAVGTFTTILQSGVAYTRNNAFSFNASTGAVSNWDPNVNGLVNSVAVSADCSTAYLGGIFTSVHGTAVKNLVSVSASTGAVNTNFTHTANGRVEALLVSGNHVLVGGYFTSVNNSPRRYLASVNPTTGLDDAYLDLNISGNYVYTDAGGLSANSNPSRVYNLELSPNRSRLLVMGDFTSVAGYRRQQIFMLDLGASSGTLDAWYSSEFNAYCAIKTPFYVQAAAWSPDGASVYVATTGLKPATGTGYLTSDPRGGLCDAAAAFPSTSVSTLSHRWINYTGCDSLFSITADANDVYVAGHERWANNGSGCNNAGPGSVSRPGIGALSPSIGAATTWNPTRSRGQGADDMITTTNPPGLWIASDNAAGADQCGGVQGHAGICFLPA